VCELSPKMPEVFSGRYEWIIVTGALGAFGFGWGTGSNDVANAFGTSVGAKTLNLKQAVFLAVIFEFTGAIVLGRVSAETIAGGIAKADTFKTNPPLYAYGMSIVLWLGFLWQAFASSMGWNVSATHSIIGGIIGFAITWGGSGSVFWAEPDSTKIPPIKGVVPIILSWFISPILTGFASALIYGLTRYFVLSSPKSTARAV
jgi:sodium-dependent phosphate transporter